MKNGHLLVVEGPENTGKTSLAQRLAALLNDRGTAADYMSFPGRGTASIGAVVYDLEHHPERHGLVAVPPVARQALHLAAHLDAIVNRIKPSLAAGRWIVLDRFWWSMWAHGIAEGLSPELLRHLLAAEAEAWKPIEPAVIFSTLRNAPYNEAMTPAWRAVAAAYASLARDQEGSGLVETLAPDASLEERAKSCLARLTARGLLGTQP